MIYGIFSNAIAISEVEHGDMKKMFPYNWEIFQRIVENYFTE